MTNEHSVADASLREMLERRSRRASPAGLAASILATTAVTRQQVGWTTRLRPRLEAPAGRRLLVLGIVGVTLIGGALAVAGGLARPAEKELDSRFFKPFEYAIPAGSELQPAASGQVVAAWVVGENDPGPADGPRWGGQAEESGNTRGILVATGENAWIHGNAGREELPDDPIGFLETLRDSGDVDMEPIEATTLDGRPAAAARTARDRAQYSGDLHVAGPMTGLATASPWVLRDFPYRLIVTEVDGYTIFVQIWARSNEELDAFMPVATEFVDSIHFVDDATAPVETPAPSAREVNATFVKPFEFAIPDGSGLELGRSGEEMARWFVGADHTHGITVATGEDAWIHPGAGRVALPDDPAGFIATLREVGSVDLDPTESMTLDGRPAMTARMARDRSADDPHVYELHVTGPMTGLSSGPYLYLNSPQRLIVTEVDGFTVLVQVWARSNEELDAFMPVATEFVDSIHFLGGAPTPTDGQDVDTIMSFARTFEYRRDPNLVVIKAPALPNAMVAFTTGGRVPYPRSEDGALLDGAHGITIASARGTVTHACAPYPGSGRVKLRDDPAGFLEDLRANGGVGLGEPATTTFDGWPALAVTVDPGDQRCDAADFHVSGDGIGRQGFVLLNVPSRLIVADVDGWPIVIQVWASTEDDLAAWLPGATAFLDGIHFTARPSS